MSECTHDCSSCEVDCESRKMSPEDLIAPLHDMSVVNKVVAVVSGKGGVGKSLVTGMLAVEMHRREKRPAILDADITGPSIPKMFGVKERAKGNSMGLFPEISPTGTQIMSTNLLVEEEDTPVVWRGPVIAGTVKQFWTDVIWENVDYMFVDMPPGTGDVPLTIFQSLPLDGIIIVTSPTELASVIVSKAVKMAQMMNVPILGIVENMSYVKCPCCGKEIKVFGESHVDQIAEKFGLPVLAKLPIDPEIARLCDEGLIEMAEMPELEKAVDAVEAL